MTGPIVIGYDGSAASERALREAGALLAPRPALVVVVYEPGVAFDLMLVPSLALEPAPAPIDIRTALEVDRAMYEGAQRLAQQGAELARRAGLDAQGLVVADEITVAETLVRVADERDAPAIVVGYHAHGALGELLLGSTSRGVLRRASRPVVVVRGPGEAAPAGAEAA
jgi:nucleotide-binding universal stress UspA family protein